MNNTVKYTSGYGYNNNKLDKTRKFVENTPHEYEQKYGANYHRSVRLISVANFLNFLDEIKNETKNLTIEKQNIVGELNEIKQSSKGLNKLIKIY